MLAHGIHGSSRTKLLMFDARLIVAPSASTATTPTAATTVATSAAATATATLTHRARLIHHQCPAHELLAVTGLDRSLRCAVIGELGESKAAGLTGELITNDLDGIGMNSRL